MQQLIFGNARQGLCGIGLLVLSYLLFFFDPVEIIKSTKLKFVEGSYAYQLWQKPPVKVYVNVYIFNVTNADRFLSGDDDKLNVEEIGPYVYWEELENTNGTFNDNDTITYTPVRKLHFDYKSSIGNPETDRIVVPNIPLLGFSSMLTNSPMFVNLVFNSLVEYLDSKPILSLTVNEFLWGYDDQLVKMASNVLPSWINFAKFGLLDRMLDEGNNIVTMNVPTERQTKRPYSIDQFNGSPILRQWVKNSDPNETDKCSLKQAAEGVLFPRHLTTDMNFLIYRKAFCRTLPLTYYSEGKLPDGYPVYLYKFQTKVFNSSLDENRCYCPEDGCLPSGLSDISPCYYNIPVAVSFPHFYGGDPSLAENVNGLHPDVNKHESMVAIQPDLGVPLSINIKIQLNLIVKPTRFVSRVKKFNDFTVPVCWLHMEVKQLPDSLNALLNLCFNVGPVLVKSVVALSAAVGFFLVGLNVRRLGRDQRKQQKQRPANGSVAGEYEHGGDCCCPGDDGDCRNTDDGDGDDDDDDDDDDDGGGGVAESGELIVKVRFGAKSRTTVAAAAAADKPSYLLPLHVVPTLPAAVIDYDYSHDRGRGR